MSQYQKGKTNLDFTEARDNEWQWHHLDHMMQVCTSLQTDNHASTPPLSFLQAGCPSCRPTNSVKTLNQPTNNFICKKKQIKHSLKQEHQGTENALHLQVSQNNSTTTQLRRITLMGHSCIRCAALVKTLLVFYYSAAQQRAAYT